MYAEYSPIVHHTEILILSEAEQDLNECVTTVIPRQHLQAGTAIPASREEHKLPSLLLGRPLTEKSNIGLMIHISSQTKEYHSH
jgi:hypothetical protein